MPTDMFPPLSRGIFAGTIFFSAFLLFAIQPLAAKHLLPWFGGSSSVWATSLFFFTGVLFLGYLYVFFITARARTSQSRIHLGICAAAALLSFVGIFFWQSLFPPLEWTIGFSGAPSAALLGALLTSIGLPYFLLSTTGPLLQYWWGAVFKKEPYKLYALSNVGSFLALLSYPFVIEPRLSLPLSEFWWAICFVLVALTCAYIAYSVTRADIELPAPAVAEVLGYVQQTKWILYATLPAIMLVAVTTQITQVVAPVPLLWVMPLAVYLLTFVLAFSGWGGSNLTLILLLVVTAGAYALSPASWEHTVWQGLFYVAALFFCGLACHARAYRARPDIPNLPRFYLCIALGGMVGTLLVSIVAPYIFSDYWEFPLGLVFCALFAIGSVSRGLFPPLLSVFEIRASKFFFCFIIVLIFVQFVRDGRLDAVKGSEVLTSSRNFYGTTKVLENEHIKTLMHGKTVHGLQLQREDLRFLPTTYYIPESGVGRALLYEKGLRKDGVRVAVLGLGTGSVATYCAPSDTFVFYEIDPRVVSLAKEHFSYLSRCSGAEVRVGDGRKVLETELRLGEEGQYDLLIADAFADDTVPVHLMTVEALDLYSRHVRSPQSIIAFNVSNKYLDLAPIVFRAAAQLGFNAMIVRAYETELPGSSGSAWVILTRDLNVLRSGVFENSNSIIDFRPGPLWTDDYSSIFNIIMIPL